MVTNWIPFLEINFDDISIKKVSIDTRDFHALASEKILPYYTRKRDTDIFFTSKEVIDLLVKLEQDSGGKKDWRFLSFDINDDRVQNWNLKYLRIIKIEENKWVVCNNEQKALPKFIFDSKIKNR